MATSTKRILLSEIRIDGGTQPREEINDGYVQDLVDADVEKTPPLTVYFDGVCHWLADGFHRYHAHMRAGKIDAVCDVITGTKRDAVWYSLGANTAHGLRRSNSDKRKAIETALADPEWSTYSSRVLQDHIGVSHAMILEVKDRAQPEPATTVTGKDGKTYPAKRSKKSVASDETTAPAQEPEFRDGRGAVVTDPALIEVFHQKDRFLEIVGIIGDAKRLAKELGADPIGAELRSQKLETDLTNASSWVKAAIPYAVCPYRPNCDVGCKCCKGKGWVTVNQWNAVPEEVRKCA